MVAEKMSPVDLEDLVNLIIDNHISAGQYALTKMPTQDDLNFFQQELEYRYRNSHDVYVHLMYPKGKEVAELGALPLLTFYLLEQSLRTSD